MIEINGSVDKSNTSNRFSRNVSFFILIKNEILLLNLF